MVYLSLGSNMGNRLRYLELAVGMISYRVGKIHTLSSIYETPAWGFESEAFFNLCLGLETTLSPEELLRELLAIEVLLGRKRSRQKGYTARTIDLDILFYDHKMIDSTNLQLPHPRIEERKFILTPLCEIADDLIHPSHNQSIRQLEINCPDQAIIERLEKKVSPPIKRNFIAIEGNIGVGKTSLAKKLITFLGGTLLLENFYDNPYLAKFYEDPETYALLVETAFLEERISQYHSFFSRAQDLPIIADYSFEKSLCFAKNNLTKIDFEVYEKKYQEHVKHLEKPELILFLQQHPKRALQNIQDRNRSMEKNLSLTYLNELDRTYTNWVNATQHPLCVIDIEGVDFMRDSLAFYGILQQLFRV